MNAPKNSPVQIDPVQNSSDKRFNETLNDEMSLTEVLDFMVRIVDFMIRKRNLILSVTIIFTLLAAGYAQSIIPKYKATIGFLMPQEITPPKAITSKNNTEYQKIIKETKKTLYQEFLMKIQSYSFQREVFESGNFLDKFVDNPNDSIKADAVVLDINKSITLTGAPAKNTALFNQPVSLEMESSKPWAMTEFLNALVKAGIKTIPIEDHLSNIIDQRLKTISSKKEFLLSQEKKTLEQQFLQQEKKLEQQVLQQNKNQEQQVLQLKKSYEERKNGYEKEIELLTKELTLARSMNINENNFSSDQPLNKAPRWYIYGAQILEKELALLKAKVKNINIVERAKLSDAIERVKLSGVIEKARLSDKTKEVKLTNNPQINNLNKELKIWESFKALKGTDVVVIDQPSIPPTQPIQNKKPSIILAGLFVGLLFGSALAFFQHARRNLRARRSLVSEINNKKQSFVFKHSSQAVG